MKLKDGKTARELIDFIDKSPTAYQAVSFISGELDKAGFSRLWETDHWDLEPGKGYYIERNGSSLAAFLVGNASPEDGFLIAGAHTDSPGLKLKPAAGGDGSILAGGGASVLPVEVYGGPVLSTWLDRDLSIAGIVQVKRKDRNKEDSYKPELFDLKRPVAVIPNLAIHLNRDVNKGVEYNPQLHMSALISSSGKDSAGLKDIIAREIGCPADDIGPFDLFLYDTAKGVVSGINDELLVSGRLDNLAGCHAILSALKSASAAGVPPLKTPVGFFFDNEEIGSRTMQGADSGFLKDVLDRVVMVRGGTPEDSCRARAGSFMISVDGAHAVHPNFPEKHDTEYAPRLNGGPVIKSNAGYKYATTSEGEAFFRGLCETAAVPAQSFVMRSDLRCGSTIGPMTAALGGIKTVDVGIPMLAMHSIRETAGVFDQQAMIKVLSAFFD